ncbi:hypothetical protein ABZ642_28485 [Streptomyces sp. NPDC007157]|uniref:effector-associated constant component EACC1 n=1 Tax=Streptomyces sp. NPDC007157 TaxID=3154681 RepID=UPI0033C52B71
MNDGNRQLVRYILPLDYCARLSECGIPSYARNGAIGGITVGDTVRIEIRGETSSASLRSLYTSLVQDPEWRARVGFVEARPQPETLGSLPEALAIVLAPGGAVAVLVGAVVSWARRQAAGDVVCKLSRPDGSSVEVSAPIARSLRGPDELGALVENAVRQLERGSGTPDGE